MAPPSERDNHKEEAGPSSSLSLLVSTQCVFYRCISILDQCMFALIKCTDDCMSDIKPLIKFLMLNQNVH